MSDTLIHCNTLQHTRTCCNSPQHTATHCNSLQQGERDAVHTAPIELPPKWEQCMDEGHLSHCNTLQHTRTHRNSLQLTATHYARAREMWRTLPQWHCLPIGSNAWMSDTFTHCNALQHTRTHCNSPQHTATHCSRAREMQRTPRQWHCLPIGSNAWMRSPAEFTIWITRLSRHHGPLHRNRMYRTHRHRQKRRHRHRHRHRH